MRGLILAIAVAAGPRGLIGAAFSATLSNDRVSVRIDETRGTLAITDCTSDRTWRPDPWGEGAGYFEAVNAGRSLWWRLSECSDIAVTETSDTSARIVFANRRPTAWMPEWSITTEIALEAAEASFRLRVIGYELPAGHTAGRLNYPLRSFHLRTDVERGAAVIPFWQGVTIPSHIFPMNGGRFCMWDDAQHQDNAMGELRYYGWNGLTMPWFGIHDDRSAIMTVVPYDGSVGVQYVANSNRNQQIIDREHRPTDDPRILALTPVWHLGKTTPETVVTCHVLAGGNHVTMAKRYRHVARENELLVTLEEKARKNPDVNKLAGALYAGIYGGYPHYVNLKGMAFTFDDLDRLVKDMHDELGLERAFVHAWGTFSRYAPVMWPISDELGGEARLKEVVDRVKGYGWLYSSYHSFVSLLEHDPEYNIDLAVRDDQGRPIPRFRWNAVDEDRWADLARACLPREMAAIGQNADVTDIAFCNRVGDGGGKLADYLVSTGLVLGTERGNEWLVPKYHMFEGMVAAYRHHPICSYSHPAPLFNLVYHDAIVNYGKIQDPTHLPNGIAGDYYIKTLRSMLSGDGPMLFFAPYEYEGVRPYIRFAAKFLGPLHRSIAFHELVDHAYLSPDFLVQRSKFANGVEVTVNLGPTPFKMDEQGARLPGYGFRILKADDSLIEGRFGHRAEWGGTEFEF